jgi:hypothetical protein
MRFLWECSGMSDKFIADLERKCIKDAQVIYWIIGWIMESVLIIHDKPEQLIVLRDLESTRKRIKVSLKSLADDQQQRHTKLKTHFSNK